MIKFAFLSEINEEKYNKNIIPSFFYLLLYAVSHLILIPMWINDFMLSAAQSW